jgi:hypothetical protein
MTLPRRAAKRDARHEKKDLLARGGTLEMRAGRRTASKYGAIRTTVDGISFASKREAARYAELKLLLKVNQIRNLELQPKFPIEVRGVKVCTYVADFQYQRLDVDDGGTTGRWTQVVEDAKGMRVPIYRLKAKLVKALYGIEIQEV